jgi:hypothetical protein
VYCPGIQLSSVRPRGYNGKRFRQKAMKLLRNDISGLNI